MEVDDFQRFVVIVGILKRSQLRAVPLEEIKMVNTLDPILVPIDDGAKIIGVKRTKFYSIVKEGSIPLVKIGRKSLVSVEALKAYVTSISQPAV